MKPPIPPWLRPVLRRKITGELPPFGEDYEVANAALAGVGSDDLQKRFKMDASEILQSLRRVACEVRAGKCSGEILDQFQDLRALEGTKRKPKPLSRRWRGTATPSMAPIVVDTSNLPAVNPNDENSLPEFLRVVKENSAKTLAPLTMAALERNVAIGDNHAIAKSLEMLYGVGRRGGPLVAMQFNEGGGGERIEGRAVHEFERIIMDAEKEDGTSGGEVTIFDERLLQQQEDEG